MKKLMIISAVSMVMLVSNHVSAQRVMNDPSYSVNNYKHPNKAAYMKKQQEKQPVVYLEEVKETNDKEENSLTASSNYKGMNPSNSKIKQFRVTNAPAVSPVIIPESNGNYKQQFKPRTKKSSPEEKQTEDMPVVLSK